MVNQTMTEIPFSECTLAACDMSRALYQYIPYLGANVFFLAYFALVILFTTVWHFKCRSWFFTLAMTCGCLCKLRRYTQGSDCVFLTCAGTAEVIGYTGRVLSHENPFRLTPFLLQICCLTIGPAYFAAAIYYCLSRLCVYLYRI